MRVDKQYKAVCNSQAMLLYSIIIIKKYKAIHTIMIISFCFPNHIKVCLFWGGRRNLLRYVSIKCVGILLGFRGFGGFFKSFFSGGESYTMSRKNALESIKG